MKLVAYIGVIALAASCGAREQMPNTLSKKEVREGWELLFDGRTLAGWHSFNHGEALPAWSVRDGAIHLKVEDGVRGWDLTTDREFENFDLSLEWKISPGGNSGIFIGVKEGPEYGWASSTGIEMQVLDNTAGADRHDPSHLAGAMYDLFDASESSRPAPVGEWNKVRIRKKDGIVTFRLNGVVTAETCVSCPEWDALVAASKWYGADRYNGENFGRFGRGKISLQDHFDEVWFRNIKIRQLN